MVRCFILEHVLGDGRYLSTTFPPDAGLIHCVASTALAWCVMLCFPSPTVPNLGQQNEIVPVFKPVLAIVLCANREWVVDRLDSGALFIVA